MHPYYYHQGTSVSPIDPTKRGLKVEEVVEERRRAGGFTHRPDEKGTESTRVVESIERMVTGFTHRPDEKGTER